MDNYSIDLFYKLDLLRNDFQEDNIHCYELFMLFIDEIFIQNENNSDIYLSLQENLKLTINQLLSNVENDEFFIIDKNIRKNDTYCFENFIFDNKNYYLYVFSLVQQQLQRQQTYFLEDDNLIIFIKNIIQYISDNTIDFSNTNNDITKETRQELIEKENLYSGSSEIILPFEEEYEEDINCNIENICEDDYIFLHPNLEYIKEFILRNNLKEYKCDCCNIKKWKNKPIMLELSFKDNIRDINNVEFLCPNCKQILGR